MLVAQTIVPELISYTITSPFISTARTARSRQSSRWTNEASSSDPALPRSPKVEAPVCSCGGTGRCSWRSWPTLHPLVPTFGSLLKQNQIAIILHGKHISAIHGGHVLAPRRSIMHFVPCNRNDLRVFTVASCVRSPPCVPRPSSTRFKNAMSLWITASIFWSVEFMAPSIGTVDAKSISC